MSRDTTEAPATKVMHEPPRPTSPRMTFEEFLVLDDERMMSEWVDGEVIFMSPTAIRHQELMTFLVQVLGLYVTMRNAGMVIPAPFVMKIEEGRRGREPDVLFVSSERTHLIQRTYLDGPADLAVEIVSPESIERDRNEKFGEYERAGVKEYWLIDPDRERAEFYELGADGRYRGAAIEPEGVYRSQIVPGFCLRAAWLWQTPAPTLDALRELKLI